MTIGAGSEDIAQFFLGRPYLQELHSLCHAYADKAGVSSIVWLPWISTDGWRADRWELVVELLIDAIALAIETGESERSEVEADLGQ